MQRKQNNFGVKYGNRKNKKAKWINNIKKKLQGLNESLEEEIYLESLRALLEKVSNSKTPAHDNIYGFWF